MKTPICLLVVLSALTLNAAAQDAVVPEQPSSAEPGRTVNLAFSDAPVADVLHFYAKLVDQQMVSDVAGQGPLTIQTNGNVTREQAAKMIEDTLFLRGYELVDSADGATVKVISPSRAVRPEGIPIYYALDELPKHERMVSYVVRLKQADPGKIVGLLQQYRPPSGTTHYLAGSGGVVILTARTSMIRPLAKLVEVMDVPSTDPAGAPTLAQAPVPPALRPELPVRPSAVRGTRQPGIPRMLALPGHPFDDPSDDEEDKDDDWSGLLLRRP